LIKEVWQQNILKYTADDTTFDINAIYRLHSDDLCHR
jgi:hypothetical protein